MREAEHHVDGGGEQRRAERQPVGRQRARLGDDVDETRASPCRRLEHQRGQRQQHDGAQEERGESQRDPEARAARWARAAAIFMPRSRGLLRTRELRRAVDDQHRPAGLRREQAAIRRARLADVGDAEHQHLRACPPKGCA